VSARLAAVAAVLLTALLILPAQAKPRVAKRGRPIDIPTFYEREGRAIATVEFVQEYSARGSRRQVRGFTDGAVISADGLVLISGRVRFPQQGSGRLSGGTLPELSGFRLYFADGRELAAETLAFDNDLNLGVLRITDPPPEGGHPHVRFQPGFIPQVGDGLRSMTLYSREYGRKPVYSPVVINALIEKPQAMWSLGGASSSLLGAPLWNERGRVVGVIAQLPTSPWAGRQVVPDLTGPVGLSYDRFASFLETARKRADEGPAENAPKAVAQVENDPDAGWLGIEMQPLERDLAEHLGISAGGGVIVSRVIPDSAAEAAGMMPLDVLVSMDGKRIAVHENSDLPLFAQRLRDLKAGSTVVFTRERRGGETEDVSATLLKAPKSELEAERRTDDDFEFSVREITLDVRLGQRLPKVQGVVIDAVERAGWAGLAKLPTGVILQRVNKHDVVDLASFEAAMAEVKADKPDKVLLFVRYRRSTQFHVAEPDWDDSKAAE
jgi:S1-C subfamily serine protease